MPARWQQWMPRHIDRWRGSPAVRAMHPAARDGYWELLSSQWQSEDCTLPNDALQLAELSLLGDELWAAHSGRILRNFEVLSDGRLRNKVCHEEWLEAKRKFEANSKAKAEAGKRGASARWKHGKPMAGAMENDGEKCLTGTGTGTKTEEQKQIPSRVKRERQTKTAVADERHAEFKAAINAYWHSKNNSEMPWGPMEGKQLGMWLREAPHITIEQFKGFLRGRFKSDVNHGDRPAQWIRWITSYGAPVDRFNKPKGDNDGKAREANASPARQRVDGNRWAIAEALAQRGVDGPWNHAGANGTPISEPGHAGDDGGIPDGFRAAGVEVLPPES